MLFSKVCMDMTYNQLQVNYKYFTTNMTEISISQTMTIDNKQTQETTKLFIKLVRNRMAIRQAKNILLKLKQSQINRRNEIQMFIKTQANYRKDIQIIWQLREQLLKKKLITSQQQRIIFPGIESIRQLSQELLKQLQENWDGYSFYQCFGSIILKKIPFFKIYIDNITNFESGTHYLIKLKEENNQIKQLISQTQQITRHQMQVFMLIPFQKFLNYQIYIKGILDKTDLMHPDYKYLHASYQKFLETYKKINFTKDKFEKWRKMGEIDRKYLNGILDKNREYLFEDEFIWINDQFQIPVLSFFFNDTILFINNNKVVHKIKWNENCHVKDIEDKSIIKNWVAFSTEDGITLIKPKTQSKQLKLKLLKDVTQNLIIKNNFKKQSRFQHLHYIQVKTIGRHQRINMILISTTVYVVELKIKKDRQIIQITFPQLIELDKILRTQYKSLKDKKLFLLQVLFFNHNQLVIQQREIIIQLYLQFIINQSQILENPQLIRNYLKLPNIFYNLKNLSKIKNIQNKPKADSFHSMIETSKSIAQEFLTVTQLNMQKILYNVNEEKTHYNLDVGQIDIRLMNGEIYQLNINKNMSAQKVCQILAKKIGLQVWKDFRLFHESHKHEYNLIPPNELIIKFCHTTQKKGESTGFFRKLKNKIKGALLLDQKTILVYKKFYWLPNGIEKNQYKLDPIRLHLISYQTLSEIKQNKYKLSLDQYPIYLTYYVYLFIRGYIDKFLTQYKVSQSEKLIHKVIPDELLKYNNLTQQKLIGKVCLNLKTLDKQIETIQETNREKLSNKYMNRIQYYLDKNQLCQQLLINQIKSNHLYGNNIYYIQLHDETLKLMDSKYLVIDQHQNMWLAIQNDRISFLSFISKQRIMEVLLENIKEMQLHFHELKLWVAENTHENIYIIHTQHELQILHLIQFYKQMKMTMKNIDWNCVRNNHTPEC